MLSYLALIWTPTTSLVFSIVAAGLLTGVVITLYCIWQTNLEHRREIRLKRELAARGFGVDEIERIIRVEPRSDEQ